MATNRLSGKVAIVTGAANGIGAAIASLFKEEGATVVGLDITATASDIVKLDVSSAEQWHEVTDTIIDEHGKIDILVNNAGIVKAYQGIADISFADWDAVLGVNLRGTFLGMRSVIPHMRQAGGGAIVNVASIWGAVGTEGVAAYQASKGAVRTMTKNAAVTYASANIRANAILPGLTMTPLIEAQDDALTQRLIKETPLGRSADPREIAYGALFFASDESSFVTGTELPIDGGYMAI